MQIACDSYDESCPNGMTWELNEDLCEILTWRVCSIWRSSSRRSLRRSGEIMGTVELKHARSNRERKISLIIWNSSGRSDLAATAGTGVKMPRRFGQAVSRSLCSRPNKDSTGTAVPLLSEMVLSLPIVLNICFAWRQEGGRKLNSFNVAYSYVSLEPYIESADGRARFHH